MAQVADTLLSKPRPAAKKGGARRTRRSGWVPAVAYGPSTEPRLLALDPKTLVVARMAYGYAHIYNVEVEGDAPFKALIKEIDKDPVTREPRHVDLYAVDMTRPLRLSVRIELVGKPKGLIDGGILQQARRRIDIECLPANIPDHLEVDVSELGVGESLHVRDMPLPEGVKALSAGEETIAVVVAPQTEEAAGGGAEGEGAAAASAEAAEGEKK